MSIGRKGKEFSESYFDAVKHSPKVAEFIAGLQADLQQFPVHVTPEQPAGEIILNNGAAVVEKLLNDGPPETFPIAFLD